MKKILIAAALIGAVLSSSAFAKTEGNNIGIDVLRVSADNQYKNNNTIASNYNKFDDSSVGVGVNYNYAFNFDKFFVAPGVFADKLGTVAKDQDDDTVAANYRYGAKVNFGYDITDQLSAYVTGGVANVAYKVDWKSSAQKQSGTELGYIAGIGMSYKILKNLALNLEYNVQSVDFKTPDNGGINTVSSDINVMKFGVAYNF